MHAHTTWGHTHSSARLVLTFLTVIVTEHNGRWGRCEQGPGREGLAVTGQKWPGHTSHPILYTGTPDLPNSDTAAHPEHSPKGVKAPGMHTAVLRLSETLEAPVSG